MDIHNDDYANHRLSIAPMLDITTIHFRYLVRLLTKETLLYTEMIHTDAILNSKKGSQKELEFTLPQKPIVLQLGGNDPDKFQLIAPIAKEIGYDEININCGCPSGKVAKANFGACLMKNPELVAQCCSTIKNCCGIQTTVKCRLGLNTYDPEFLQNFISIVHNKGNVNHFIMHARIALMKLDTEKNRKIPPLQYDTVFKLQDQFSDSHFSLNGGIKKLDDAIHMLETEKISGCMIGRAAFENIWMLRNADSQIFNKTSPNKLSRKEIVYTYSEYCENVINNNESFSPVALIKPLTFLFAGESNNSMYKTLLYSFKNENDQSICSLPDHLKTIIEEYEKVNTQAVNEI